MIKGIPASGGIGIGKAVLYKAPENTDALKGLKLTETEKEKDIARLNKALEATGLYFEATKVKALQVLGQKEAQMFEAYKMVLKDPIFNDMVTENINKRLFCAEAAVLKAVEEIQAMFSAIDNEYMKQRAEDVMHVGNYILDFLLGRERIDLSHLNEDTILVARDLTPADTIGLDKKHIKGFAIEKGGMTSHTAIVARTLEIPAIVGCGENLLQVSTGDTVILDGVEGIAIRNPAPALIEEYKARQKDLLEKAHKIEGLKAMPAETPDGIKVELAGNVGKPDEAAVVLEKGGDAIGLFRTEFLYMDSDHLPTEEEQFQAYKKAAGIMGNKPCIIRTMDIGGDKQLKTLNLAAEENPFLGYRAIRICLKEVDMFKTQLRAILRAGCYGNLKIMFPMISGLEELREAKKILNEIKNELDEKGIPYDKNMQTGIMIEVPSAALTADLLAKEADFFSIGTNDLCQYTLAVDRMNEKISALYNPLNIGVLRLIKNIIDSGHAAGIKVAMCGEMAAGAENAVILLGLGLDEFSMTPASIPHIKNMIRNVPFSKAKDIAEKVMKMESAEQISDYVKERLNAD